jgi:hypothetical protein
MGLIVRCRHCQLTHPSGAKHSCVDESRIPDQDSLLDIACGFAVGLLIATALAIVVANYLQR